MEKGEKNTYIFIINLRKSIPIIWRISKYPWKKNLMQGSTNADKASH